MAIRVWSKIRSNESTRVADAIFISLTIESDQISPGPLTFQRAWPFEASQELVRQSLIRDFIRNDDIAALLDVL